MAEILSNAYFGIYVGAIAILVGALLLYPSTIMRWVDRKRYQYEVSFALYMLTSTEKFIFNSFIFLFAAMIIIATSLYLPEHLSIVVRRAFYYLAGDDGSVSQPPLESAIANGR
ncbi:hypothetical protein NA57DRAFT_77703 [Rhizodiscina lignyota]|uniref:Uncharacterized protein n=1 Tax=Rhizodiscina lignyota TaxID=1504668 RepID=A0A9P4I9F0_9PEZI|nr:hypothetical protein NA57DRAFT_77703 [Rhizodiscina lignyota]